MKLNFEQDKKVLAFLKKYGKNYPETAYEYIKDWYNTTNEEADVDIIKQIYSYTRVVDDEYDIYKGFSTLIDQNFNINSNILEVAGGFVPALANRINEIQNSGSITVYEPNLVMSTLGKVKLVKEKFTEHTDIKSYDLVCALYPCDATALTLEKACVEKKDFIL